MSVLFGILTAIGFGAGDFWGGLASKKVSAFTVSFYSQVTSAVLIGITALLLGGLPETQGLVWGTAAGVAVGIGIIRYYKALSFGTMGLTATVMGVFSAIVPFITGLMLGERPSAPSIFGVVIILVALVLVTRSSGDNKKEDGDNLKSENSIPERLKGLSDAVISGICFGFSFVFVGLATTSNPLWPVFATAVGSLGPILIMMLLSGNRIPGAGSAWKMVVAAGSAQAIGFIAFGLAILDGLISIVSVAGALSPIPTAIIALIVLGEKLTAMQLSGIAMALAGVLLLITA